MACHPEPKPLFVAVFHPKLVLAKAKDLLRGCFALASHSSHERRIALLKKGIDREDSGTAHA